MSKVGNDTVSPLHFRSADMSTPSFKEFAVAPSARSSLEFSPGVDGLIATLLSVLVFAGKMSI